MLSPFENLILQLRGKKQSLCVAESCTGGRLSTEITQIPGVSDVYMGGFIVYSNQMKREILSVPGHILNTMGAVSPTVALYMALGAKSLTQTSWSVSITGIAGPGGRTDTKPVGTVCFAIVGPGFEWTSRQIFHGSRVDIQKESSLFLVQSFLGFLMGKEKDR